MSYNIDKTVYDELTAWISLINFRYGKTSLQDIVDTVCNRPYQSALEAVTALSAMRESITTQLHEFRLLEAADRVDTIIQDVSHKLLNQPPSDITEKKTEHSSLQEAIEATQERFKTEEMAAFTALRQLKRVEEKQQHTIRDLSTNQSSSHNISSRVPKIEQQSSLRTKEAHKKSKTDFGKKHKITDHANIEITKNRLEQELQESREALEEISAKPYREGLDDIRAVLLDEIRKKEVALAQLAKKRSF